MSIYVASRPESLDWVFVYRVHMLGLSLDFCFLLCASCFVL